MLAYGHGQRRPHAEGVAAGAGSVAKSDGMPVVSESGPAEGSVSAVHAEHPHSPLVSPETAGQRHDAVAPAAAAAAARREGQFARGHGRAHLGGQL